MKAECKECDFNDLEGEWCMTLSLKSRISWKEKLLVATWNVRTAITRAKQQLIFEDLHRPKIAIAALQECEII